MQLNWKDLEVLLRVCEAGSLTAGASRCHLSLPAVSARIRRLEELAGAPLLVRSSRGVQPSLLGKRVLEGARSAELALSKVHQELNPARHIAGRLSLMCNTSAMLNLVPSLVGDLIARFGWEAVEVDEASSRQIAAALRDGRADFGILSDAVSTSGLVGEPICEDALVLAVSKDHPIAGEQVFFHEALAYPQLCFGRASALTSHLTEHAHERGLALEPRVAVNDLSAILDLAQSGVGVAVVSDSMWHAAAAGKSLRRVRLADRWARRRLMLCRRPAMSPGGAQLHTFERIHQSLTQARRVPTTRSGS